MEGIHRFQLYHDRKNGFMTLKQFVNHPVFSWFILGVILFNSALIGIGTYVEYPIMHILEKICVWIFLVEIVLKFIVRDSTKAFVSDAWNIFDVIIVASAFIPNVSSMATILRILRVFRIFRLVKGVSEMRLIVNVLIKSTRSMTYISMLMFICFYVYAIIAVELFGETQAAYSTLHESFFSLFRSLTAEDWTDLRYEGVEKSDYWLVTLFHVSWIILRPFLLINLVVGAVINNYNEVQEIEKHEELVLDDVDKRIIELSSELQTLLTVRAQKANGI